MAEGAPYLRGTWLRNPYLEDGAPYNRTYTSQGSFGSVPRGGNNGELGGFQIDQNNGNPTAGESLPSSAGLCTLCHSSDVDTMNKNADGGSLWVGTGNGHSNSALGGTATDASNIFGPGYGRPAGVRSGWRGSDSGVDIMTMAMQVILEDQTNNTKPETDYAYAYRSADGGPQWTPNIAPGRGQSFNNYAWGAAVGSATPDIGYHAFTCSKCHNPHASRLPKLMITNCLDTSHNTWQSGSNGTNSQLQNNWVAGSVGPNSDRNEMAATWNTAQNCHRYDSTTGNEGGWNKVTPW